MPETTIQATPTRDREHLVSSARGWSPWLWVAALTAIAAVLRVIAINKGPWWDEIYFLVITVRRPLTEIVTIFPGDTQHPLYSVLAKLSFIAFGEHIWSLRLPAVIFGVASIPMLYRLGIQVTTHREALISAALLAVSYHHVWFSQNARGYSVLAFCALASTYFLLRGLETERRGNFVAYGVVAALGIYTHLTMLFLVASHVLVCAGLALGDWKKGQALRKFTLPIEGFVLSGVLALLLYAPILGQVQNFFLHRPSAMRGVSTPRWALGEILRGLTIGMGAAGIVAFAGLLVACGAWTYFRKSRLVFALFAAPVAMTALGAFLGRGTMYPRFYFYLIGFAVLILVRGVVALAEWFAERLPGRPAAALTGVVTAVMLAASCVSLVNGYRYPKQDFEGAIQFVDAEKKAGAAVVTAGATTFPLLQYYAKPWQSVETGEALREICRTSPAVWIVYTFPRYLQDAAPSVMAMVRDEFTLVRTFHGTVGDGDVFVSKFERR